MNEDVYFVEKQRFTQWWLWLLVAGIGFVAAFGTYRAYIGGLEPGGNPIGLGQCILGILPIPLLVGLFSISVMHTTIAGDAIRVRFFPFHWSEKKFGWDEIELCYTRTYKAISEYGGYGIKGLISSSGKAYNVSGNQGIQLVFKDGSKLLIGTQKAEEVKLILQNLGKWKDAQNS